MQDMLLSGIFVTLKNLVPSHCAILTQCLILPQRGAVITFARLGRRFTTG
jgi:hypothetical protein